MRAESPLVTPAWLAAHLGDPRIVVADARWYLRGKTGQGEYRAGHIPGACFIDVDADLSSAPGPGRPGRHPLPTADHFAQVLAERGVGPGDVVVAYDDTGGTTAARLWWLLRYFGHDVGRVLDGGLSAWSAEGHPLDKNAFARPAAPRLDLRAKPEMIVDKEGVKAMLLSGEGLLLDARASERYEGKIEPVDARPGHIPGAKSAPFADNLCSPGGPMRSREELVRHYAALGAFERSPVVAYCGSGVTACHDVLALSIAGKNDVVVYEGSWSDWAGDLELEAALGKG
ncbi:MAG TPA: sulfurtransferase [Polyangiaceae bacterium]|nr:sulfurtransferase [Polyangiaceae bacterium]